MKIYLHRYVLTFVLFFIFNINAFADRALPEFTATYAIQKFGIKVAEAVYQLNHTENGYNFSQHTKLHGITSMFRNDTITAQSLVDETDGKLLLREYTYKQTGKEKNKDEHFTIKWSHDDTQLKGHITGIVRGEAIDVNASTPVWEVLSFQLPLMIDARTKKKSYDYNALLKGELSTYNFTVSTPKDFTFAKRNYQTLHVVNNDTVKNRQLHLWLIPELHNLPVVIENFRDGGLHSRVQLESVQFDSGSILSDEENDKQSDDDF